MQISKYANKQIKTQEGMSLLEILVVVTIFAILGIITTRAVALTLQGSKKSESLVRVRENLDYSMGVIERQLRNANSIDDCTNPYQVNYTDQNGNSSSFSCANVGAPDSYIASGSARLTSNTISITNCSFTCGSQVSTIPPTVSISIDAKDATATGVQNSIVSTSTQVSLRSY